jgi:hypothetical protein
LPDHAKNHIAAWYLQQFSPRCKADQRRSPGLAALEKFARPTLRRALGGGYRREDVEFALAELRLTLRQLDNDLESLGDRNRELESELVVARSEIEGYRSKELELNDQISAAIRRACEIEEKAQARAREIVGDAEEIARRARLELHKRIEDTSNQFDELLRRKEGLLEAMLGVVGDFDQAIAGVELAELPPPATAASAEPAPAPQPEPAPTELSIPEPPPPSLESVPALEPVSAAEEQIFETRVELDAGPFSDVASLSAFERSLSHLPRVEDVYVSRLAGDRAPIELTLSEPSPLLQAMRETLPYSFEVHSASRAKIVLTVVAHSPVETH